MEGMELTMRRLLRILPHLICGKSVRYSAGPGGEYKAKQMPLARADLESILRARKLDRTLTTALPSLSPADEYVVAPTGVTAVDARLSGGFPRGHVSELVGPRSSGRTSLVLQMLAAATSRNELVAVVDALDVFD